MTGCVRAVSLDGSRAPAKIFHNTSRDTKESKRGRWEEDLKLLLGELERNPRDRRSMFYAAQSYACLDRYAEALEMYQRRVDAGGWNEERFVAAYRMAGLAIAQNNYTWEGTKALQYLHLASSIQPERDAEVAILLYEKFFMNATRGARNPEKTWASLTAAAARGYPSHLNLFIPHFLYMVELPAALSNVAYEVGEFEAGLAWTKKGLNQLDAYASKDTFLVNRTMRLRVRLDFNLRFYERKVASL